MLTRRRSTLSTLPSCLLLTLVIGLHFSTPALAEKPLHERLDALVTARAGGELGPTSPDAEFVRRAYLDFAGRIPSVIEVRAFLAEKECEKRANLVDRLTDAPEYAHHMSEFLHVMLMERLGDDEAWRIFLETSLAENKPWDWVVQQILHPEPDEEQLRGAAFFITKRLENYGQNPIDMPGLVRDIGRLFLGVDVQCAQCHDHLFVDDYKQETFHGLFAFVGHTFIRRDVTFPAVGERLLTKKVDFKSVFLQEDRATGPRLPGGVEVEIPVLDKGEEYLVAPDKKTRFPGTPKFSPLRLLAEQLPQRGNAAFTKNIVNRLWWKLMGRGLVEPLDLHHSQNPPSHPEVSALLAKEFEQHGFDMKWLLRQVARSQAYQRSSRMMTTSDSSIEVTPPASNSYRIGLERPLSAEQILASVWQATGPFPANAIKTATDEATEVTGEHETSTKVTEEPDSMPTWEELQVKFATALANPPREPEISINPSVKAALFLMNDDAVLQLLTPRGDNLIARLAALESAEQVADELYLSILSRPPNVVEQTEVAQYLDSHSDHRATALTDLAWALLAAVEFCVNH